jgi:hypothetical protein
MTLRSMFTVLLLTVCVRDLASCATPAPPVKDAGQCVVIVVGGVDASAPDAGVVLAPNPGF